MKKIFALIVLITALSACYEDYVLDFDYDGIYFPYQVNVRTFVVGEGMKIKIGVALGGVRENARDRVVSFQLDNSLISPATLAAMQGSSSAYIKNSVSQVAQLKLLPSSYYTLSDNSKMVIKKGEHSGTITLIPDSAKFLSDALSFIPNYAIPLRITSADADTIIKPRDYAVIALQYENMFFGNYWHGGVTVEKNAAGAVVKETKYNTTIPSPEAKIWKLSTIEPAALTINGVSDISSSSKPEIKVMVGAQNKITIGSVAGATYQVEPDGESTFNQAKLLQNRKLFLNYKYKNAAGNWCYAKDTLTFRNRVRDGVNEWQDENPANY